VITGVEMIFQLIIENTIRSSPVRFGVGGSPSFDTQAKTHHRERRGLRSLNPRVIERVRVSFRS